MVAHLRGMFANDTHIIVSLLNVWKVNMVGIECDDATFNVISRRYTLEVVLSRKTLFFFKFCNQGGKWIMANILKYLYYPVRACISRSYVIWDCVYLYSYVCLYMTPQKA